MFNRIKDSINSIPEEIPDQEIQQATNFDEFIKSNISTVVKTQTQDETPPIKATNMHETEFPEIAEELTQIDKLSNSEYKK